MELARIGIIGGSGIYKMADLKDVEEVQIETPFGSPSDALILGTLSGTRVAFLARHGRNHTLLPSELPFRANIYAMKQVGVEYLISASAVGSLKAEAKPLDMVIPDQFIDRTKNRVSTFFGEGIVAHIAFGDPICQNLAGVLADAIASLNLPDVGLHRGGIPSLPQLGCNSDWNDELTRGEVSQGSRNCLCNFSISNRL
jgi:5'-methylthioadenosine phosphorylase